MFKNEWDLPTFSVSSILSASTFSLTSGRSNDDIFNLSGVYKYQAGLDNWVTFFSMLLLLLLFFSLSLSTRFWWRCKYNGFHSHALSLCAPYLFIEYFWITFLCNCFHHQSEHVTNTIRVINIAWGRSWNHFFPYYYGTFTLCVFIHSCTKLKQTKSKTLFLTPEEERKI